MVDDKLRNEKYSKIASMIEEETKRTFEFSLVGPALISTVGKDPIPSLYVYGYIPSNVKMEAEINLGLSFQSMISIDNETFRVEPLNPNATIHLVVPYENLNDLKKDLSEDKEQNRVTTLNPYSWVIDGVSKLVA